MSVGDHERLLQTAYQERNNIHKEFSHMHQELQGQVAEKEGLQAKLQQLYATIREQNPDKAYVDQLFQGVMNAQSQPNVIANEEDGQYRP